MAWTPHSTKEVERREGLAARLRIALACLLCSAWVASAGPPEGDEEASAVTLRVATFHLPGVRTAELLRDPGSVPRLRVLARIIQGLRPNILVLSGLDRDEPGAPGSPEGEAAGLNAQRFADQYLATPQGQDVGALLFEAYMPATNSGQPSGMDLDRSGSIETSWVEPADPASPTAEESTARARYSGDCWGPGWYPGQRGLAVLIDRRLTMERARVRTVRLMPWDYMPAPSIPGREPNSHAWFTPEQEKAVRLCSGVLVDVPIRLPNGAVLHVMSTTPIELGGADEEQRRARRHRDEIRLLADYIDGQSYVVDDAGVGGGLDPGSSFVIAGNLSAAPGDERTFRDPITKALFAVGRVNTRIVPSRDAAGGRAQPSPDTKAPSSRESRGGVGSPREAEARLATTRDGRREDYVLPSADLGIRSVGIWERLDELPAGSHAPVWMDLWVRAPASRP